MLATGLMIKYLLIETGSRAADGNFGWGAKTASYVFTALVIVVLFEWIREHRRRVWLPAVVGLAQVAFGVFAHVRLFIELNGAQNIPAAG